jgi:hypothetical protein
MGTESERWKKSRGIKLESHTNFINYYILKTIIIKKWTKSKELTN